MSARHHRAVLRTADPRARASDDRDWPGWVKALVILGLTAILWLGFGQIVWAFIKILLAASA